MTQSPRTFKSFDPRPGHTPCRLPPLIDQLAGDQCLPAYFGLDDLREMAKFREIPNVHGLAAYPIEQPAPAGFDPADPAHSQPGGAPGSNNPGALAPIPELPAGVAKPLAGRLAAEPLVMVQGALLRERPAPLRIQAIVPQSHAHLAAALQRLLYSWPEASAPQPADYSMLFWPPPLRTRRGESLLETFVGHWPASPTVGAEGTGLVIGCDDPGLLVRLLTDAAHRATSGEGSTSDWAAALWPACKLAVGDSRRTHALAVGSMLFGIPHDGAGHFPALEGDETAELTGWIIPPPG
jgi:hypothetical protein